MIDEKLAQWRRATEELEPSSALQQRLEREAAPPPQQRIEAWRALQPRVHWAVPVAVAFAAGMLLGGVFGAFPVAQTTVPEPTELLPNTPVPDSFGEGDGVTWPNPDGKAFTFTYASPVKLVVVLHFQAKSISAQEVAIQVNGNDVGFVPPDTLASDERPNEVLVRPDVLFRGRENQIRFVAQRGDPWRIWNVWVEVFPLPELGHDELIRSARENLRRGDAFWERRSVGAENLYKAWRAFHEAWLQLEALEPPKPDYDEVVGKLNDARLELDKVCAAGGNDEFCRQRLVK